MVKNREVRYIPPAELRFEATEGQPPRLLGYASVFNTLSNPLQAKKGTFREVIRPGAFKRVLGANPDIRLLVNHEGLPLARTRSGTLKVCEDERGLRFEANLDPSDPDVQRVIPKMKRGDLTNCSFAFQVGEAGALFRRTDEGDIREVMEVSGLFDVSLVTYPAFDAAGAILHSEDAENEPLIRSYDSWKEQELSKAQEPTEEMRFDILMRKLDLMLY